MTKIPAKFDDCKGNPFCKKVELEDRSDDLRDGIEKATEGKELGIALVWKFPCKGAEKVVEKGMEAIIRFDQWKMKVAERFKKSSTCGV